MEQSTEERFSRTALLLGDDAEKLRNKRVLIVGVGGVGGHAAENIVRSGVSHITLVDGDKVDITNCNRQIIAVSSTIGKPKAEVAAARFKEINPSGIFVAINSFLKSAEDISELLEKGFDFVVDAIDSLPQKAALIKNSWQRGLNIVSSLGAGAKSDLSCIRTGDLWRSEHCVLGKNLRRLLREYRGHYKLPVVYSVEDACREALAPSPSGGKPIIGTVSYYTATFGCYLAQYVVEHL